MYYLQNRIEREDPHAVQHDLQIIAEARKLSFCDGGWEELQDKCMTETARSEIHNIEMRKYHREEYACGML